MKTLRTSLALAAAIAVAAGGSASSEPQEHTAKSPDDTAASTQARAPEMADVGRRAPDFTLTDTEGKEHRLASYVEDGKIVVLEWFNPDCPFVRKHHQKNKTMASTYAKYDDEKVVWLAINSGAPGKQGHGIERNRKAIKDYGIAYPVLVDEDGHVGRLYEAKTTPHMYVIVDGVLVYRGAIDDNRSAGKLGEENYVVSALDAVLAGKPVDTPETKSYGCTVKYGKTLP